ncbi:MAG: hypothetical protein ABL977_16720, partial [Candidatus Eisenbacteria bacterium]
VLVLLAATGPWPAGAANAPFDESARPAGRDLVLQVASVGQLDSLQDTASDSLRSACAATLDAFLLLGGDFGAVARELGVKPRLTYENLHRVQEALYQQCDRDQEPGIRASAEAVYDTSDALVDWSMRGDDEYHRVLQKLGLSAERLYGPTLATVNRKGDRVMALLAEDSTRVFVLGVYEDFETRSMHQLADEVPMNHYVLALWYDGAFHAIDPWRPPGQPGLVRWSDETAGAMLFETRNVVYWVSRR